MARLIIPRMTAPGVVERPSTDDGKTGGAGPWIVTVYNNETNTWDEVVYILMVATNCPQAEAEMETWEVDNLGKSVVHQADEDTCNTIAGVIAQIGIRVEVSKE